jgi:hypothetical protein
MEGCCVSSVMMTSGRLADCGSTGLALLGERADATRAPVRVTGRGHRRPRLYRARIITWSSLGFKYPGGLGAEPPCWRDRDGG